MGFMGLMGGMGKVDHAAALGPKFQLQVQH